MADFAFNKAKKPTTAEKHKDWVVKNYGQDFYENWSTYHDSNDPDKEQLAVKRDPRVQRRILGLRSDLKNK